MSTLVSSSGISPIQRPFARAKVGTFVLSRESGTYRTDFIACRLLRLVSQTLLTGSEPFDLAFLAKLHQLSAN